MNVHDEFTRRVAADRLCRELARAIAENDTAALERLGMKGFGLYAGRLAELMTDSVRLGLLSSDDFGEIMRQVNSPARYAHHLVNEGGSAIQQALDERNGVRLRVVEPEFNDGRLKGIVGEASESDSENAADNLAVQLGTMVKDAGNEFMRQNAEQRDRAGFKVTITRTGGTNCCPWCADRTGKWELANAPDGVFGCHDNCKCMVEYTNSHGAVSRRTGRGRFVDVPYEPPRVLTREESAERGGFDKPRRLNLFNINSELDYMSNSIRLKYGSEESSVSLGKLEIPVYRVTNSNFEMYVAANEKSKSHAVRLCEKYFRVIQSKLPSDFGMPKIVVLDFEKYGINSDAIGGYHRETDSIFMNSRYDTPAKVLEYANRNPGWFANKTVYAPYLHELGHKYYEDCIKRLAKSENIEYNKAKGIIDRQIYNYIEDNNSDELFLKHTLSGYANDGYQKNEFTEIAAESFTVYDNNSTAANIMKILREGEQNDDTAD